MRLGCLILAIKGILTSTRTVKIIGGFLYRLPYRIGAVLTRARPLSRVRRRRDLGRLENGLANQLFFVWVVVALGALPLYHANVIRHSLLRYSEIHPTFLTDRKDPVPGFIFHAVPANNGPREPASFAGTMSREESLQQRRYPQAAIKSFGCYPVQIAMGNASDPRTSFGAVAIPEENSPLHPIEQVSNPTSEREKGHTQRRYIQECTSIHIHSFAVESGNSKLA